VGEGGVGASVATDLADRTPSRRIGGGAVTVCYTPFVRTLYYAI